MTNPYEPPQSQAVHCDDSSGKRRPLNIWLFAIVWPFVCICIHAAMLRFFQPVLVPVLVRLGLSLNVYFLLTSLPVLFGYAACIVAAARYPASRLKRGLRGVGVVLVMLVCGNIWRTILSPALSHLW